MLNFKVDVFYHKERETDEQSTAGSHFHPVLTDRSSPVGLEVHTDIAAVHHLKVVHLGQQEGRAWAAVIV